MNYQIEQDGLSAARIVWKDNNIDLLTLESRVAYQHDLHKRKTNLDYHNFNSSDDYANTIIKFISSEYNNLPEYKKDYDNAPIRMYNLIKNKDGLIYAIEKLKSMYNNHI